jgi:hypothetical protein
MMSDELRKYIDMIILEDKNDELYEMANLGSDDHGIAHVVIWVGKANKQHGLRVKVSNLKDRWSNDDNFVIQMPSLDYDHEQVAPWIRGSVMKLILAWIVLNSKVLHDFENDAIVYTRDFLNQIAKVK